MPAEIKGVMSMSINISPRTDYSALFSNMSVSNQKKSGPDYSWAFGGQSQQTGFSLSDYASIKNGSYGKLLKAYYAKDEGSKTSEAAKKIVGGSEDSVSTNSRLSKDAAALTKSTDALLKKGEGSLFEEKELTTKDESGNETKTKGYDREAIYKAVSDFAKDYNALIDSASKSNNHSVLSTAVNMTNQTSVYSKALSNIGITVKDDNTLSVDKEAFDKADVDSIKSLFSGNGSFADMTKSRTEMITSSAKADSLKASGMYGANGAYSNAMLSGSSFNGLF
jgi:hypothetical protein